ncbi:MAG: hypothetical protein C0622_13180 [Desulfuromonas sp.]|nr:MAG: hypothetical protein C0622_13180 [Desulfuromonas sp.]
MAPGMISSAVEVVCMNQQILTVCNQAVVLLERFCHDQNAQLERLAKRIAAEFTEGGQLLIAANGCLQSVAQLMASQFAYRLSFERPALPAICLGNDPLLVGRMNADGREAQILTRHYRALSSERHIVLLLNDGSDPAPLAALRDDALDNGQQVALITFDPAKDPLVGSDIELCLDLGTASVPRMLEVAQFAGHLLCELVECELFRS